MELGEIPPFAAGFGQIHVSPLAHVIFDGEAAISEFSA